MFQVRSKAQECRQISRVHSTDSGPQRFKSEFGSFLDKQIADEQAKQAQQQGKTPPSSATRRAASGAAGKRNASNADSAAGRRTASRLRAGEGDGAIPPKTPDPDDFVIGDDVSDISRVATPLPVKEDAFGPILDEQEGEGEKQEDNKGKKSEADTRTSTEQQPDTPATPADKGKDAAPREDALPEEVQKKLAKLETLTSRYQDLLRNYRTAHARVASIEPFEATLREHTSLTSISDPGALVEFLNQRSVQSEMVREEFKRVSSENQGLVKERNELKVKLEEAAKKAKDAFDEASTLR